MTGIDTLDLKTFMTNAVNGVFDTMLSMEVEVCDEDFHSNSDGKRIVGSVSFAGAVMGNVNIHVK